MNSEVPKEYQTYVNRLFEVGMKKILVALSFIIVFTVSAKAQSKSDFCKRWDFMGYVYSGITFSPSILSNDYLYLNSDGTFSRIYKGTYQIGRWRWLDSTKQLKLYKTNMEESIVFKVNKITSNDLLITFKEQNDSVRIKYKHLD
jgi:hypothetical protein